MIDESHVTVPQLHGMYEGDISRKSTLVDFGFRLPSAIDNRPLRFEEFQERVQQVVYMSATPGPWELKVSERIVEQIVRPTGLIDPEVEIRPTKGQVDDLIEEIRRRTEAEQRVLVTTLTKKMAEDLTDYLIEMGIRVRYLHSEVDTIQRIEIIRDLRLGEFDVLVGINLLREGLDLPEVSLVAILDADKEGFLRSDTSLIQTIGRAARNVDGKVLMYADAVTDSMKTAISETQRRRMIQEAYNTEHGIDPQTIRRRVHDILLSIAGGPGQARDVAAEGAATSQRARPEMPQEELERLLLELEEEMHQAAKDLRFEYAARLRDEVVDLRKELKAAPRGRGRRVNRLAVRAPAAWLGPGGFVEDAQIVCEGGLVTYAGAATGIDAADREIARRRLRDAGGGRPPRPHRALGPGRGARRRRHRRPRPRVAGRADLPARRRLRDAVLRRAADPGGRPDAHRPGRLSRPGTRGRRPGTGRELTSAEDATAAVEELARLGAAAIKVSLNAEAGPTPSDAELAGDLRRGARGRPAGDRARAGQGAGRASVGRGRRRARPHAVDPALGRGDPGARRRGCGSCPPSTSSSFGRDTPEIRTALDNLRRFHVAGGTIIYGTDLGNGSIPPGIHTREALLMVEAGLEPEEVLEAMIRAPLEPDAPADLIVLRASPLEDLRALDDVQLVIRAGRVVARA